MKKIFSVALIMMLIFTLLASIASADDQSSLDKFNDLNEMSIFPNADDSDGAKVEQEWSRGPLTARMAQMIGLEPVIPQGAATFSDVDNSQPWFGYVEAAVAAGIVNGHGNGTFTPYDTITNEELIVLTTQTYAAATGNQLDLSEDAPAIASANNWAAPHIEAAQSLGWVSGVTDWRDNATLETVSQLSQLTLMKIIESKSSGIASAEVLGPRTIAVTFHGYFDPENVEFFGNFTNQYGSIVDISVDSIEWSGYKLESIHDMYENVSLGFNAAIIERQKVILHMEYDLPPGHHWLHYFGADNIDPDKSAIRFEVKAEELVKIEFPEGMTTLPQSSQAAVSFRAYNQYDLPYSGDLSQLEIQVEGASYTKLPNQQTIMLNTQNREELESIEVSIKDPISRASATQTFLVGDPQIVSTIETGSFMDANGQPIESIKRGETAYLHVQVYDQYGTQVWDADLLNSAQGINVVTSSARLVPGENPYLFHDKAFVQLQGDDGAPVLAVSVKNPIQSEDVEISLSAAQGGRPVVASIHIAYTAPPLYVSKTKPIPPSPLGSIVFADVRLINSTSVTINVYTKQAETLYFKFLPSGEPAPDIAQLSDRSTNSAGIAAILDTKHPIYVDELTPSTAYTLYTAVSDKAGSFSTIHFTAVHTMAAVDPGTLPTVIGADYLYDSASGKVNIYVATDKADEIYYAIFPGDPYSPSGAELLLAAEYSGGAGSEIEIHTEAYGSAATEVDGRVELAMTPPPSVEGTYTFYCIAVKGDSFSVVSRMELKEID